MSTSFPEAGPSRLSTATVPTRATRRVRLIATPTSLLSSSGLSTDEDEALSRAASMHTDMDSSSDPASSSTFGSVPSSASHRYVPFSLRPMASEMVRPPEVVRCVHRTARVVCPSVVR